MNIVWGCMWTLGAFVVFTAALLYETCTLGERRGVTIMICIVAIGLVYLAGYRFFLQFYSP